MRRLSSLILLLVLSLSLVAQKSPHGDSFRANCDDCHKTDGWKVDLKAITFDHKETKFPLVGQHLSVNCKQCHTSLEFAKAQTECNACHTDIHEQTVGNDCARCHTPNSWVVTSITQLHQLSRFPLIGPHTTADCKDCHTNLLPSASSKGTASRLRFDPLKVECYDCHKDNYTAAKQPDHVAGNYSTNCTDCHNINSFEWKGAGINHNFFPLEGGHAINDCSRCHTSGSYSKIPAECVSCHQPDYTATNNPNHTSLGFSTNCKDCHSLNPGWKPADYREHDASYFPIYSGSHKDEWENCSDCHTNPATYSQFSCTDCHEHSDKPDVDNKHDGVSGYTYSKTSCYACHPTGSAEGSFDHSKSNFPLTGAHTTTACADCHTNGYAGTPNACASCHINNYNLTTNPNHKIPGGKFSEDCAACHTTAPDWKPATYPTHSNLEGAHIPIANECATCHKGNYTTIPATCYDCHTADYTQSNNPSHTAAQFPTTCADCHSQTAWKPATFDHDGQYFPIYSGKHNGEWNSCADCHINSSDYKVYTCTGSCHPQPAMDNKHQGVGGYQYNSPACLGCHPDGSAQGFDHAAAGFPLTGGHATALCIKCHASGYSGTSPICKDCHTPDFNQSANPNHTALAIPNECATCHTTNPGWSPATFPIHNNYYVLAGAHVPIANDCVTCHNGNYINSPNTCFGCHANNYNQTTDPNHASAQFPTTCADCHTQAAWTPSTFNHDGQYFPIYSGKHQGEWNNCADCHTNPSNYAVYTCTTSCHPQNSTNNEHQGVGGYQYLSSACLACHPNGSAEGAFNHSTSPFPLTGGHAGTDCASCHANGYGGTSPVCAGCHTPEYNQSTNPNHIAIGIPNECATCHTTNPGWNPATFPIHSNYYVLAGAHVAIANQCADCHAGNYNSTPNTCSGCHMDNYNLTTNPNHVEQQFPTTCETCHSQTAWVPSTFDHNNVYPLTGAHATISSNCIQCHAGGYPNTPNTCAGCHQNDYNQATNPNHIALGLSNDCATCHTTNPDWQPATFGIHNNYYVLAGAHVSLSCVECHNGNYISTPNTCAGCHMDNYNQTTNPNHVEQQFPTTCETCHSQTAWVPSTFDHTAVYPLTGAHATISSNCIQCHAGGYPNTPNTCAGCHQNDYNQATNPNHIALGLSNDCATCHTTNPDWQPATFAIHNNYYVLAGAHVSLACVECHNGNYNSTPNTCAGCHMNDYNQTTDPNHAAAQFPTTCEDCHTQTAWTPSTFDHDGQYFPIYSGQHNGEWNTCSDCHPNPSNFSEFTCTTSCHPQSSTNNDHQGVSGYQYLSSACLSCHPNGSAGDRKILDNSIFRSN